MDFTTFPSRRALLAGGTAAAGLFGIGVPTFAQNSKLPPFRGKRLPAFFTPIPDGVKGPWGSVRALLIDGELCPVLIHTADKGGVLDFMGRTPTIRLGAEGSGLTITPFGWAVGKAKPQPLAGSLNQLAATIRKNRAWTSSAMQLRAAYATAFPVFVAQKKQPVGKAGAKGVTSVWADLGEAAQCTTRTITENVERTVENVVRVVETAAQRYAECYDKAVNDGNGGCAWAGAGDPDSWTAQACATSYCKAKGFVDIFVGFVTVVTTVIDRVTREVVDCVEPVKQHLPDRFDLSDLPIPPFEEPGFIRDIRERILQGQEVARALVLLRGHLDGVLSALGPFACFLRGEWNVAVLPLVPGVGVPFGVEVCITAACARSLTLENIGADAAGALVTALSLLATFNPGAAAALAALNIAPIAELAAAVAGLGPVAMAAGAVIAALILAVLYHATLISAQLSFALRHTDVAADGKVCFVHPTLAAAVLSAVTLGTLSPVQLVPPVIVS